MLVVGLLVLQLDDLKAILAVLELVFVGALLDIMLEQLGDFYVLGTELAVSDVLAFLSQMEVVKVLVLEFVAVNAAEFAISVSFFVALV